MRINFQRTGGFMGRTVNLTLDLDELPADQAGTLKHLLDEVNFFSLEEDNPASPYGRDVFHYLITVETETIQHTVRVSDTKMPASLRPLVENLSRLARSK